MRKFKHKDKDASPLKSLLLEVAPINAEGNKTITFLADLVPMSRWGMQKWLRDQKVPADRVLRLCEISKMDKRRGVDIRRFAPFVENDSYWQRLLRNNPARE